jgi:phenylalanyl-tRNA synthetase beta chain
LAEVRTSKLLPRKSEAFGANAIDLRNPLSEDHVSLRPNLLAGLCGVLARNVRAGAERVAIFELGRVFLSPSGKEQRRLGILLWGNAAGAPHWKTQARRALDFFDLKGAIESLTDAQPTFQPGEHDQFALGTRIWSGSSELGIAGQLLGAQAAELDASGAVLLAEIDVDLVLEQQTTAKRFREIDRFPAITRDIAMIVPEGVTHEKIENVIRDAQEPLLESVQLFDLFAGSEIGPARKSLAYSLTYRDRVRTLTNEEVTAAHAKIRERLQREIRAELRE